MNQVVELHLLGTPAIVHRDGARLKFPIDNPLLMLAQLVLDPQRVFLRDELAYRFYPDSDDLRAKQNLRQVIHRLRGLLQEDGTDEPILLITPQTIQVNPQAGLWCDVHALKDIYSRVRLHPHRRLGVCTRCLAELRKASSLFAGDFLQGFTLRSSEEVAEWVDGIRTDLRGKSAWMLAEVAQSAFDLQEDELCRETLEHLRALDPYDEGALRLSLMLDTRRGHRTRALKTYFDFRKRLYDELAVAPETETIELAQAIQASETAAYRAAPRAIGGDEIALSTTPFTGREEQLAALTDLLDGRDQRLITLIGGMGMGKTRLALEAAWRSIHNWEDGVYFVALRGADPRPADLKEALVRALGIPTPSLMESRRRLFSDLNGREALIILDDADAFPGQLELVQNLSASLPRLKFLLTTRSYLKLPGQVLIALDGLDLPGSVEGLSAAEAVGRWSALRLFADCARREKPSFQPTGADLYWMRACCELLAGIPQAIEWIAPYLRTLDCAELYRVLRETLDATGQLRALFRRQNGELSARFDPGWLPLSELERRVLATAGLHPDGLPPDELASASGAGLDVLQDLTDRSVLLARPEGRLRLHPLVGAGLAE